MSNTYSTLKNLDLHSVRSAIRSAEYTAHTAGLGFGYLQANLVILPEEYALDFMRFCQRNPKPCPLVGVSDTGNALLHTLGQDIDIRTDVPAYNIYKNGKLIGSVTDIKNHWRNDLVVFALGCSFTFERALKAAGIDLWHITNNTTVPMFRSTIQSVAAGSFQGPIVVSMRMIAEDRLKDVREISHRYPLAHGAPVYWGDPKAIGIEDITRPDWGDPAPIEAGKIPVFWACGVTPQAAVEQAKLPFCITHKPGHMLITEIPEDAEVPVFTKST